jgi:hypothetical protein
MHEFNTTAAMHEFNTTPTHAMAFGGNPVKQEYCHHVHEPDQERTRPCTKRPCTKKEHT